jgi:hypothetical protein
MGDMTELEALKRRKEQLLLEQEVARLERKQQMSKAGNWSWWWVAPVSGFGAFLFIAGLNGGEPAPVIIGLAGIALAGLKIYFKR